MKKELESAARALLSDFEIEALDGFQHCRKPWLVRTLPGIGPEVSGVYHQPTEARKPRQHPQAANDPIRKEFKTGSN